MSLWSFPVLENADLFNGLEDMEVVLDANTMAKPTYEVLRPILEQIVINMTGVSREELIQPNFNALEVFEHPGHGLHDECIPTNNFVRQLSKLLLACDVSDFGWKDVFRPDPTRLRRHLSALVNFAKYREEKRNEFQECEVALNQLAAVTRQEEDVLTADRALLAAAKAARAAQQAEVSPVESAVAELDMRNRQLCRTQKALAEEVRLVKEAVGHMSDLASQAKMDLQVARQDIDRQQDQIVQSPDKQRQAIVMIQAEAEKRRGYLAQMASTKRDNDRRNEAITKFEKELRRCLKLLEDVTYEVGGKKDAKHGVKDVRNTLAADERRLREVVNAHAMLKRQSAACGEKFDRLKQQAATKQEAAQSLVTQQAKEKDSITADNAAVRAHTAEGEAQIRTTREAMSEAQHAHHAMMKGNMDRFTALRKVVGDFNRQLVEGIETDVPAAALGRRVNS